MGLRPVAQRSAGRALAHLRSFQVKIGDLLRKYRLLGWFKLFLTVICEDLAGVFGDLAGVFGDLAGVFGDLAGADGDLAGVDGDLAAVNGDLAAVNGDLAAADGNLAAVRGDREGVRLFRLQPAIASFWLGLGVNLIVQRSQPADFKAA